MREEVKSDISNELFCAKISKVFNFTAKALVTFRFLKVPLDLETNL